MQRATLDRSESAPLSSAWRLHCIEAVKVRDLIVVLRKNGWVEAAQVGSHRQFKHPARPGRVTVSGEANAELPTGTLRGVFRQAGPVVQ